MFEFLGIYWAGLDSLIFLPIFIVLVFFVVRDYLKTKKIALLIFDKKNTKLIFNNFSLNRKNLKTIFMSCALFLIFLALLRPQWGKKEATVTQEGRDLLIALDISRSMMAQDLRPSRLEFIKLKIRNLLEKLDFERVGLILFSGSAFLQCPLTVDHAVFLMFLDQVDVESIASGTTAIDSALNKAMDVFGKDSGRKNKLVLLATDGEDFSLNLETVKQKAKDQNIRLFALGTATIEGAPIPKLDYSGKQLGHELDQNGHVVLSKLNEEILIRICSDLGGNYFRASFSDTDLNQLVNEIKQYEKEKFSDKKLTYFQDQYPWLLGLAWILLALEWVL